MTTVTNARISISDRYLDIEDCQISHPEVLKYFRELPPDKYQEQLAKVLEIGCVVMTRVSTAQELDYVEARLATTLNNVQEYFIDFENQMREALKHNLDPTRKESFLGQAQLLIGAQADKVGAGLSEAVRAAQNQIQNEVGRLGIEQKSLDLKFDPNNSLGHMAAVIRKIDSFEQNLNSQFLETDSASFVGKLRHIVDEHFGSEGHVINLIDKKLQITSETPMGQMYFSLKNEIVSLRDVVMKLIGQQELIEQTTKKGYPFEDIVFDKLQEIAKPHGDVVEDTSKKVVAISGSKKGDYVYTIANTDLNIVLDAKNYNKLRSLPAMLGYLKDAMVARNSKIGIIVAPHTDNLQKQIGEWNVYANCIITPLSHLEVSIKYAKYVLQLQESDADNINVGLVKQKLNEIIRKMREFSSLKTKLTKLSNGVAISVEELQKCLDSLRDEISEKLIEIESEF